MFIAIAGVMSGMLKFNGSEIIVEKSMLVVLCLAIGTIIGELIGIEKWFDSLGEWLKIKSGNGKDSRFVDAFVTASLTVSIGAMGVVGSIQDGLTGDYSTLVLKSVLDFIIIAMMTSSMGIGSAFSVLPVFVIQLSLIHILSREPNLFGSRVSHHRDKFIIFIQRNLILKFSFNFSFYLFTRLICICYFL